MGNDILNNQKFLPVERKIKDYLNSLNLEDIGITETVRTIGDKIPEILSSVIESYLNELSKEFKYTHSGKSIANFEFIDAEDNHYFINVVTHCMDKKMSRPNLTSVKRLFNLYIDNRNYFIILLIDYYKSRKTDFVSSVKFIPIEYISIDSLGFGALGTGQIQIKKANEIIIREQNREDWMLMFTGSLIDFYYKLILTTKERIAETLTINEDWKHRKELQNQL
ncbi:MAG: hypothetical protein P4L45_01535 [Ignavibacteriaceae bacterium]|nr:hypothetical protein [Ignavibacteriaceae bacterium]